MQTLCPRRGKVCVDHFHKMNSTPSLPRGDSCFLQEIVHPNRSRNNGRRSLVRVPIGAHRTAGGGERVTPCLYLVKNLMMDITTYKSRYPGKKLVIMGGVHGDETCGAQAIRALAPQLNITAGQVTFIIGNPKALKENKRFIDSDLNRTFFYSHKKNEKYKGYEYRRAQEILPYLRECDALLDIHSMNHPQAVGFVICEPQSFSIAARLPFSIRSSGWDNIHTGSADAFVNASGGNGLCIECGYKNDPQTVVRAKEAVRNFLKIFGAVKGEMPRKNPQQWISVEERYLTKKNFTLARSFANFEKIRKRTYIGTDGGQRIYTKKDCRILFAYNKTRPREQAFILAKDQTKSDLLAPFKIGSQTAFLDPIWKIAQLLKKWYSIVDLHSFHFSGKMLRIHLYKHLCLYQKRNTHVIVRACVGRTKPWRCKNLTRARVANRRYCRIAPARNVGFIKTDPRGKPLRRAGRKNKNLCLIAILPERLWCNPSMNGTLTAKSKMLRRS